MTRLWANGDPITVRYKKPDAPYAFTWQGRSHAIQGIVKRWRVDRGWWHQRTWREYLKLHTRTGLLVIVYRDLLTGQWYLQRLFD